MLANRTNDILTAGQVLYRHKKSHPTLLSAQNSIPVTKQPKTLTNVAGFFVRLFVPDRQKNRFFHRIITHSAYALMLL